MLVLYRFLKTNFKKTSIYFNTYYRLRWSNIRSKALSKKRLLFKLLPPSSFLPWTPPCEQSNLERRGGWLGPDFFQPERLPYLITWQRSSKETDVWEGIMWLMCYKTPYLNHFMCLLSRVYPDQIWTMCNYTRSQKSLSWLKSQLSSCMLLQMSRMNFMYYARKIYEIYWTFHM